MYIFQTFIAGDVRPFGDDLNKLFPIIIEGGAGSLEHLDEAFVSDADGVAIGTMLVFSDNNLVKIKRYLAQKGHAMRLG